MGRKQRAFQNRCRYDYQLIPLSEFSSTWHESKITSDCWVFKFLRRSVNGKHLMRFQSETFVFKFLRRSVNGKHLMRFQSETFVFKFPDVLWTENIWCVFRVKPPFLNSSSVAWTEHIWCVFRVKPPFSTSPSVVWTENIWWVLRLKPPFSGFSGEMSMCAYSLILVYHEIKRNLTIMCLICFEQFSTNYNIQFQSRKLDINWRKVVWIYYMEFRGMWYNSHANIIICVDQ